MIARPWPFMSPAVAKELRPLLPAWLGCLTILAAVSSLGNPKLYAPGLSAAGVGAVALGALSMGHEYLHGTLGMVLMQPVGRCRVFVLKLAVLVPMLLVLAGLAWAGPLHRLQANSEGAGGWAADWTVATVIVLPFLCALVLAPVLTTLFRSPLAGIVFTPMTIGFVRLLGGGLALAVFGFEPVHPRDASSFTRAVFSYGTGAVLSIAALVFWPVFRRLEEVGERNPEIPRPRIWTARRADVDAAKRQPRLWLLVKKEIGLQHTALLAGGLYLFGFLGEHWFRRMTPGYPGVPVSAVTMFFSGLLALLIGSLASAEERHLGTLEWQALLPMASWRHWVVKAGTAVVLALALGVAWPALLMWMAPPADAMDRLPSVALYMGAVVALTTGSLYVSSLSTSGLKAVLTSLPLALLLLAGLEAGLRKGVPGLLAPVPRLRAAPLVALIPWLLVTLAAGFVLLVLSLAAVNHERGERSVARVSRQVAWMLVYVAAGALAIRLVAELARW